jgi:signal transduction histidine kinase
MDHGVDRSTMFIPSIRSSVIVPLSEVKPLLGMRTALIIGLSDNRAVTGEFFAKVKELGIELNGWFLRYGPILTTIRDQREEKVRHSEEAKEAALFVHDARAPLAAVKLLLSTIPGVREELGQIDAEIEYLEGLFEGFSVSARGLPKLDGPLSCRLSDVLVRVTTRFAAKARNRGLSFEVAGVPTEYAVSMAPRELERALSNVVGNALQHTSKGGISVEVSPQQGSLAISIKDTGSGMSRELLEKLTSGATKVLPSRTGWGVGLLSVKNSVERADGAFGVTSEIGVGTAVSLCLRRAPDLPVLGSARAIDGLDSQGIAQRPMASFEAPAGPLTTNSVVLVDDDPDQLSSLARVLSASGFSVVCVTSVEEALSRIRGGGIRAILCDSNMPDGGAITLLRELKGVVDAPPLAVLTGEQDQGLAYRCAAFGAVAMFTKPAEISALADWCRGAALSRLLEAAA